MIITIRELNAFAIVLEKAESKSLANEMQKEVLRMIEYKINEVDIKDDTPDGKQLCKLIKKAEDFLKHLKKNERMVKK